MTSEVARGPRDRWIVASLVCLLLLVAGALVGLQRYKALAGDAAPTPLAWPAGGGISIAPGKPVLLAFAHPLCPCTRATLSGLRALSHHFGREIEAVILFELPAGGGAEWRQSGSWRLARAIPGLRVGIDADGRTARLFGAETSGHVVLYDARGGLVFSGGITPARGHEGANAGLARIARWLADQRDVAGEAALRSHPVFGCSLVVAE